MPPSIDQYLGAASFPLYASDVEATQTFPDPVKLALLQLIVSATNAEFGTTAGSPWYVIRQGTSLATKNPVEDSLPTRATEQLLKQRQGAFPFVFLGRIGKGEFGEDPQAGFEDDSVATEWVATWCLGPLNAGEKLRFENALEVWWPNLVRMVIDDLAHPSYNGGNTVFGPGGIPLGKIEAVSYDAAEVAIAVNDKKELYYGVDVTLKSVEYSGSTATGTPFLGENHSIKVNGVPGILELNTTFKRSG